MTSIYPLNVHSDEPKTKSPIREIYYEQSKRDSTHSPLTTVSDNCTCRRNHYNQQSCHYSHDQNNHYNQPSQYNQPRNYELDELKEKFFRLNKEHEEVLNKIDQLNKNLPNQEKDFNTSYHKDEADKSVNPEEKKLALRLRKFIKSWHNENCRGKLINIVLILASVFISVLTIKEIKNLFTPRIDRNKN
jgi:hypothetical protein